jgi:hemerythrin-like metal-binding protein
MHFEWKDSYRVGDVTIDGQHRHLFELANKVFAAQDQGQLQVCAMDLFTYVRVHFAAEEAWMRETRFPGYVEHIEQHNRLITRLSELSHGIGKNQWDRGGIHAFMKDWLLGHILQIDAQAARHAREA